MLKDRNIAFFIDIDGLRLTTENYLQAVSQLESMGTIIYGKLYGCGERKHKAICKEADLKGYRLERVKRVKRRGRREFDNRIFVDAVDAVCTTPAIDAVCIASPTCDMVYLYSYLRGRGIKIIALNNNDEANTNFVDEILDLGIELEVNLPKPGKPRGPRVAVPKQDNDELLKQIEQLQSQLSAQEQRASEYEEQLAEAKSAEADAISEKEAAEQRAEEAARRAEELEKAAEEEPIEEPIFEAEEQQVEETAEEPVEEPAVQEETIDEAKDLLEKYYAQATGEEVDENGEVRSPAVSYVPQSDSDLIRKIEEIREAGGSELPEDLAEQIKKLLEGIE